MTFVSPCYQGLQSRGINLPINRLFATFNAEPGYQYIRVGAHSNAVFRLRILHGFLDSVILKSADFVELMIYKYHFKNLSFE